ncbi:unnamed protein product [Chrysodeixis includens]|uniref:Peroxidase n=1 Tax=Chrysodeixis includens TaxID=689277 RepID=A0A9N8PYP8_CHRIL|nr:unnamed protein product [Chrysodeixis includens]
MNKSFLILIFVVLCSVRAQELPGLAPGPELFPDLIPGPEVLPPEGNGNVTEQVPITGKKVEEGVPVIYDAYFGKPITTKRRNTLRPARDGSELPSARLLRTSLLGDGYFRDHYFSTLATHFQVTTAGDNVDLLYALRYVVVSDCCLGNTPNRVNPICIPIPVPAEDPYLLPTGIRCLNLTKVITYQELGCLPNSLPAERYSIVTPLLDLGLVYGNTELRSRSVRANQGGLLAFRMEGDREVPNGNSPQCLGRGVNEPICYNFGRKNALEKGIIYETDGYVNDFDPHQEPGVIREYIVGTRWFHTYQPGQLDMYSKRQYQSSISAPLLTLRSGYLANNDSEAQLTEGCYIQPADKFDDYVLAPDLVEQVSRRFSARASDLTAIDFMRGRDAGFPPYNHYREFCGLKPAKTWEDLHDTIDPDKVEILSRIYDEVEDVELMVAIYVERFIPGAFLGPTLYCIMVHNLLLWRQSDKFFFEHGGFPAALTIPQLNQIRQTSIARVLCDNGDDVKHIQPAAFFRQGPWYEYKPRA